MTCGLLPYQFSLHRIRSIHFAPCTGPYILSWYIVLVGSFFHIQKRRQKCKPEFESHMHMHCRRGMPLSSTPRSLSKWLRKCIHHSVCHLQAPLLQTSPIEQKGLLHLRVLCIFTFIFRTSTFTYASECHRFYRWPSFTQTMHPRTPLSHIGIPMHTIVCDFCTIPDDVRLFRLCLSGMILVTTPSRVAQPSPGILAERVVGSCPLYDK